MSPRRTYRHCSRLPCCAWAARCLLRVAKCHWFPKAKPSSTLCTPLLCTPISFFCATCSLAPLWALHACTVCPSSTLVTGLVSTCCRPCSMALQSAR
ncbi:hypothetical protein BX661DRAFT_218076 [Kickxella alabastrina]|uniref:uncharacterized protein n=1 Tax=Kickxella alabastrina TaxID=61397 RepID=UPI00221F2C08|nr:uncharacterized protein BX661DRAFT_218076 [Kickxella alabastrina]KAI7820488.1 hypothetical protein BX661DRAFT_218076 [Kickxella alabastrina]